MTVYGDLGAVRDYVYVEDVVDALVRVHERGRSRPWSTWAPARRRP